jgi:hypothetical protein
MVNSDFVNLIEKLLDLQWCISALNNPPHIGCIVLYKSCIKKIGTYYIATNRGTVNVKWLKLDFTLLRQTVLQYRGLPRQKTALKCWLLTVAIPIRLFLSWLRGNPLKDYFFVTTYSTHLSASEIHAVPVPSILHCQSPCSRRHIFLIHNFKSVKPIRCGLLMFTPQLTTNGHNWHNISWHYSFKKRTWSDFITTQRLQGMSGYKDSLTRRLDIF